MRTDIRKAPFSLHRWEVRVADRKALVRASHLPPCEQPSHYQGVVVRKPWGHEFQCFANPRCAVWCLHLAPGATTSLHAHPGKRSALVVVRGEGRLHGLDRAVSLQTLDTVELAAGVFHGFEAGADGAQLLELESPPTKTDLVRLEDRNGRLEHGIEGRASLVATGLASFGHFDLRETSLPGAELTEAAALSGRPFFALGSADPCRLRFDEPEPGPLFALGRPE